MTRGHIVVFAWLLKRLIFNVGNGVYVFCLRLGIHPVSIWMDKWKKYKGKFIFLLLAGFVFIVTFFIKSPSAYKTIPNLQTPTQDQTQHQAPSVCPLRTPGQTIIHLNNTKHLLVSAYMDQRVKHGDVRIIGIFRRDSIQPLLCVFCCNNQLYNSMSPAGILQHSDNFGFPFATTDVMCEMPQDCRDPSVTLLPHSNNMTPFSQTFLPVQNQESGGKGVNKFQFSFTVCISSLFGNYNNVLQLTQTLEMYRCVLHKTNNSCMWRCGGVGSVTVLRQCHCLFCQCINSHSVPFTFC